MLVLYAIGTELLDCNPVAHPPPPSPFVGKERVTAVYVGD